MPELLTPVEAAQYLRLDEIGIRTPASPSATDVGDWTDEQRPDEAAAHNTGKATLTALAAENRRMAG